MSNAENITAVIGLGTGRSGTTSLARFLSFQGGVIASHWSARYVPFDPAWRPAAPTGQHQADLLDWWTCELEQAAAAGATFRADVSPWHLHYVGHLMEHLPRVKCLALYRPREETAESWARAISRFRFLRKNDTSPRKAFPTFPDDAPYDAALTYWDLYHAEVDRLLGAYPGSVLQVGTGHDESIPDLNTREGQDTIIGWLGVSGGVYPKDCVFHTVK